MKVLTFNINIERENKASFHSEINPVQIKMLYFTDISRLNQTNQPV